MPKPRLADFKEGIVPIVRWPKIRGQQEAIEQIRKWIASGELYCPENQNPDATLDLLFRRPKPAMMATPATAPEIRQQPAKEPEPQPHSKKRMPELKGFGWIAIEQEFTDGLILPVGCRITPFDPNLQHKHDKGDISAALESARELTRQTGDKPMVSSIAGYLRVLRREFLTGDRPAQETKPRMKAKS